MPVVTGRTVLAELSPLEIKGPSANDAEGHKGKLNQLRFLIDLSFFIVTYILLVGSLNLCVYS
jgi:hypothetical protein